MNTPSDFQGALVELPMSLQLGPYIFLAMLEERGLECAMP